MPLAEVLVSYVIYESQSQNGIKVSEKDSLKCHGKFEAFVTDWLRSCDTVMKETGNNGKLETGYWLNNACEDPHWLFRRQKRSKLRFRGRRKL